MSIDKRYKLYVFDLDGTLVDTRVDIARALKKTMKASGFGEPDLEQVVAAIGGGAKNAVCMLTGLVGDDIRPVLDVFKKTYDEMCSDNTCVYEGGETLLNTLKSEGAHLALVTMKLRYATHKILRTHGLDMFDDVIAFDDVEKRKPDPESFLKLLSKYKIAPKDALMIGDTVTDMRYAKAAGVDACAMTYGYGITEDVLDENPKYKLDSLLEF